MLPARKLATRILPVKEHGQDGHGTPQECATGVPPVLGRGRDGHGTPLTASGSSQRAATPAQPCPAILVYHYSLYYVKRIIVYDRNQGGNPS